MFKFKFEKNIKKEVFVNLWVLIVVLATTSLVFLEYLTLSNENMLKAYKNSELLVTEIENIIKNNNEDEKEVMNFLKETYSVKAKAISYLLDNNPELENDVNELKKIANLMAVDEIYLFDETGTIYSGSKTNCIGYNFDTSEQMKFFKPMLKDKTLTMNQDMIENTVESKQMMYSICWNEKGTRMVQVGIEPVRLLKMLKENKIENIVSKILTSKGLNIIITDKDSQMIKASSKKELIGSKLEQLGIILNKGDENGNFSAKHNGQTLYCTLKEYDTYKILVTQEKKLVNINLPVTLVSFTEYLLMVFIIVSFLLDYMYNHLIKEKSNASKDRLTNLYNYREYENTISKYNNKNLENNLVFISMDLNGLKQVNDNSGHSQGDQLLRGAAFCIKKVFNPFGKVFRVGGDEFVAIIYIEDDKLEQVIKNFQNVLQDWSQENHLDLSISFGIGKSKDYEDVNITELAKIADKKMYEAKSQYYQNHEHNRRIR